VEDVREGKLGGVLPLLRYMEAFKQVAAGTMGRGKTDRGKTAKGKLSKSDTLSGNLKRGRKESTEPGEITLP